MLTGWSVTFWMRRELWLNLAVQNPVVLPVGAAEVILLAATMSCVGDCDGASFLAVSLRIRVSFGG